MTTKSNTLPEVLGYFARFYNTTLDEFAFAIWAESMKEYDLADIKRGFVSYMKTPGSRYMPKPGQLIPHIKENLESYRNANRWSPPQASYEGNSELQRLYADAVGRAANPDQQISRLGWIDSRDISKRMATDYMQRVSPLALRKPTCTVFGERA